MPSIKKNYIFNLAYQLTAILVPLILTPYVSRVLGPDGVGSFSFTFSLTSYFTLFATLGTALYGQREIAWAGKDTMKRSRVFWEVAIFRCITSFIAVASFCIAFRGNVNYSLYLAQSLNILAVAFDVSWFFIGLEQFQKTVPRNIFVKLAGTCLVFIFVKNRNDVHIYAGILSCSILVGNLSLIPFLRWELVRHCGRVNPFRDLRTIIQMFLPSITISIYTVLDKTMLGLLSSDYSQNGYYEQSEKIVKTCITIITAMGVVCIPRIAAAHASGDADTVKRLIFRNYRFVWFLSLPMAVGLIVLAPQIVTWFLGSGWESASSLIGVLSLLLVAIGLSNVTGMQYFIPTGKQNMLTATLMIGAVLNMGLNFVLIPHFGAMGAAVATIVAEIAITVTMFICVRKLYRISNIMGMTPRYFIGACVMGISLYCIKNRAPSGVWGTGLLTAIGCFIYAISLWALRDSFFLESVKGLVAKSCKKLKHQ